MNDLEADLMIANAKIKQLEQELAEKTNEVESMRSNWYKCSKNYQQKCRDIAELEIKLAEIQRRERAAVELIGKVSQAVDVAFNATDYVKPNTGIWHTLGLALDWIKAWRGPMAGEENR